MISADRIAVTAAASILTAGIAAGCGPYSFSGSSIPPNVNSVAIPLFEDRTAEFGIKERITNELIDKFISENLLQVRSRKNADSVLLGTIVRVNDRPFTYDEQEQVEEYRVDISVALEWIDTTTNKNLFKGNVSGWGAYSAASPADRESGLDEAVERLVTAVVNQTLSGW